MCLETQSPIVCPYPMLNNVQDKWNGVQHISRVENDNNSFTAVFSVSISYLIMQSLNSVLNQEQSGSPSHGFPAAADDASSLFERSESDHNGLGWSTVLNRTLTNVI